MTHVPFALSVLLGTKVTVVLLTSAPFDACWYRSTKKTNKRSTKRSKRGGHLLLDNRQLDGFVGSKHGAAAGYFPDHGGQEPLVQPRQTPLSLHHLPHHIHRASVLQTTLRAHITVSVTTGYSRLMLLQICVAPASGTTKQTRWFYALFGCLCEKGGEGRAKGGGGGYNRDIQSASELRQEDLVSVQQQAAC